MPVITAVGLASLALRVTLQGMNRLNIAMNAAGLLALLTFTACNICLPDQPCETADPGDVIETIQCFENNTTIGGSPVCQFSMDDCGDGNSYQVTCSDENTCSCRRSNSDGTVDVTEFTLEASCAEFSTDDGKRMGEFVEANCGWEIIVP